MEMRRTPSDSACARRKNLDAERLIGDQRAYQEMASIDRQFGLQAKGK